jgi:NAD(P)-dependent dehydrogenase (short-subunit alcohol dehydrogenase family)
LSQNKPILVTGASSGIGRMVTDYLAQNGHLVYACARKQNDIETLNEIDNVISFRLDVTNPEEVKQAADRVKTEGRGLYALINNAGVGESWPILATEEEMLHRVLNVNVYGPFRITNALIPFIMESEGRIVNISSVSGLLTPIYMASYSMSKFALEAWSNALLQELKLHNVKVSLIEPGNYSTNITGTAAPLLIERYQQAAESMFLKDIEAMMAWINERMETWTSVPTPEEVVEAIMDALFSENPKPRYLVISQEETELFSFVLRSQITKLGQLFKENTHGVTKQELLSLIDEIID